MEIKINPEVIEKLKEKIKRDFKPIIVKEEQEEENTTEEE